MKKNPNPRYNPADDGLIADRDSIGDRFYRTADGYTVTKYPGGWAVNVCPGHPTMRRTYFVVVGKLAHAGGIIDGYRGKANN